MAWIQLIVAGLLETGWAVGMKYSDGLSKLWPSIIAIVVSIGSFFLLARALKVIDVGTGYAVWTGIGAVGTAIFGIILFGETANSIRLTFIAMIIVGIVGLWLTNEKPPLMD